MKCTRSFRFFSQLGSRSAVLATPMAVLVVLVPVLALGLLAALLAAMVVALAAARAVRRVATEDLDLLVWVVGMVVGTGLAVAMVLVAP